MWHVQQLNPQAQQSAKRLDLFENVEHERKDCSAWGDLVANVGDPLTSKGRVGWKRLDSLLVSARCPRDRKSTCKKKGPVLDGGVLDV